MIRYISILLSTLLLLASCGNKKEQEKSIQIDILRGPSVIALAHWLKNPPVINGIKANVRVIDSPQMVQASLIKQESDIAVLPTVSAANLYNKGVAIRMAGCPIWGTLYLVERDAAENSELYIFGQGTTPDILTRYYIEKSGLNYTTNHSFQTALEVAQGIMAGKIRRAVLGEPFISMALQKVKDLRVTADLNLLANDNGEGFAQTAILYSGKLAQFKDEIDRAIRRSCEMANSNPEETIRILEEQKIFAKGALNEQSIKRCKIDYQPADEAADKVISLLKLIMDYEPKAIGGKLPDATFIGIPQGKE